MMNTIGKILTLTTFGESHGPAMGGVLDGMPAGVDIDLEKLQRFVDRRRTGQTTGSSSRDEKDRVEVLSGIWQGKTLGTPIGFVVRNTDAHSEDYKELANVYRPNHADFTYQAKYGTRDPRGGGRASARETVARVVAGGIALQALSSLGISVEARIEGAADLDQSISQAASQGDTLGGIVVCTIKGVPAGLGEPVFGKLHAALGAAMLSINAVKGFDIGDGFDGVGLTGSQMNDEFYNDNGHIRTRTNHSGGIQGGISNGEDIVFRVLFKPVPTILREQHTVNTAGNEVAFTAKGRHDPCVLTRAVPIVEAMAAMTILDYYLLKQTNTL